jgi:serine/threonine protein kinase
MSVLTCASTGQSISLDKQIATSGEGEVWQTNRNGYLAKVYHSSDHKQTKKLEVMMAYPPKEPNSHLNHISFAWPKSLLKDRNGKVVGFLMPAIPDAKELLDVYHPQRRRKLGLEIDWRFLHTTALNIASIIQAIHAEGYVLGDIKPQNILVNNCALPSIIDTDSFQVRRPNTREVYRCLVGSEGFTPPELMGKDFHVTDQTEVHDRFRLAVIIYLLLFGDQPFKGKWTSAGDSPDPSELLRKGFWPYAPNSPIQPGPMTIPINTVHPEVHQCFLQCFNTGYARPEARPTAEDWVKALRVANKELIPCGKVNSHYYSKNYDRCYWCERVTSLGIDVFPAFVDSQLQKTVTRSSSSSQIFAANNILELVKQQGKEITVVGQIVKIQSFPQRFLITLGYPSQVISGYSPFTIVINSEDLPSLAVEFKLKGIRIDDFKTLEKKCIYIRGNLELHEHKKARNRVPQIVLKDFSQANLITEHEADNLLQPFSTSANASESDADLAGCAILLRWIIWPGLAWEAFSSGGIGTLCSAAWILGLINPSMVIRFGLPKNRWIVTLIYLSLAIASKFLDLNSLTY